MDFEADFYGVKGVLKPLRPPAWQTVHTSFLQRNYEVRVILSGGGPVARAGDFVDSRWVEAGGDRWELQLLNKTGQEAGFLVKWLLTASERVCCFNPVAGDD